MSQHLLKGAGGHLVKNAAGHLANECEEADEPSEACVDCNTNCPHHATTNEPDVTVTVAGSCTDPGSLCTDAADTYPYSSYNPATCQWSWRTFAGMDPGYVLVLECVDNVWYAYIYHNSGGEMPTLTAVFEGNPAVICADGKLWGEFELPGTDGSGGSADCDGCTATVTINKDPD